MAKTYHLHRLARSVRVWRAAIASQMPRPCWPMEAFSAARLALTSVGAIYLERFPPDVNRFVAKGIP